MRASVGSDFNETSSRHLRRVQAVLGRQIGKHGERERLRNDREADRSARDDVALQIFGGVLGQPVDDRKSALEFFDRKEALRAPEAAGAGRYMILFIDAYVHTCE